MLTWIRDTNPTRTNPPGAPNEIHFEYDYGGTVAGHYSYENNTGDQDIFVRAAQPARILYGPGTKFVVEFSYAADRNDLPAGLEDKARFIYWTHKRLTGVTVKVDGAVARGYRSSPVKPPTGTGCCTCTVSSAVAPTTPVCRPQATATIRPTAAAN